MADNDKIKETLNLPSTSFSMKAKLAQKEPEILEKWEKMDLYQKILKIREGSPTFVLHDGPPYANGNIHLGTALNKILKDFIIKTKTMQGYLARYRPGWDCHGLPIEIKVDQILGERKKNMNVIDIREECKNYALQYVDIQRKQFLRLGVFGEWKKPYLTMDPSYEAEVLNFLADFFMAGNVYKGKKPVYWCTHCKTALAEAEIEYKEHKSPSIYVKFPIKSDLSKKFPELKNKNVSVLIWTTTPWTLPANLAIAFHPDFEYSAFEVGGEVYIAAKRLIPLLSEELELKEPKILLTFLGKEIEGFNARHPFIDRDSVFVLADYVTLEQGTGCVHTAPGHGHEDYLTGLKYGLEVYTPVDADGNFTPEVEKYKGMNVFQANEMIISDAKRNGTLWRNPDILHSYPHCWRCKNPVIFRATAQWFISMDENGLRDKTLDEVKKINWIPSWGEERIANMIKLRPDWCISRQRMWGVPIPAFICRECGSILANESITRKIAELFAQEGSNSWYIKDPEELLPAGTKCPNCGSSHFNKENNILDVWFESGASHNVLGKENSMPWPADVYIEGHDQYRGWFNSSLLIGTASKGRSPYQTCITHGFVLDDQGRGMSKSLGNFIEPEEIISKNGAEILRLWVAMLNYKEDARFGDEILKRLVEAYRKIRNTWRFILGNLNDFSPDDEMIPKEEMLVLDRWALEKFRRIGQKVLKSYNVFEYHTVFHTMYNLFTVELSSIYLDILKDRLYCSAKKSNLRKSAQVALFYLLQGTLKIMAPLLPFTTEEAWEVMPSDRNRKESVHLESFPEFKDTWLEETTFREIEKLMQVRDVVLKELESTRENKIIGNSLEARVLLKTSGDKLELLEKYQNMLAELFIVSEVKIEPDSEEELKVIVEKVSWQKCQRCWNYSEYVGKSKEYPDYCLRCEKVVRSIH
ncbi:MAG: isoleucine--tRNA ligase [Candidatus Aminicenantes bacterium]|nr:isoleucine--tRNA ligase [Candidatus Aminicenantes bacterium]